MLTEDDIRNENWMGSVQSLRNVANTFLEELIDASGKREELERKGLIGGYFAVTDKEGQPIYTLQLGALPVELDRSQGRFEKAVEKAFRLAQNPGHTTSMESANHQYERYGGAVRGVEYLHSFSGLPEKLDEIFSCLMAYRARDMAYETAARIIGDDYQKYLWIVHGRQPVK
ncbi:MAG TPA: hypothetical protein VNU47_03295 [Candidatus Paceibacterota bacterium]|nr:hypothetical protein [Candidatus Paceibacterota bacterium]